MEIIIVDFNKLISESLTLSVLGILFTGASFGFWFSDIIRVENKNNEIKSLNSTIKNLKNTLSEKESSIKYMENEITQFKEPLSSLTIKNRKLESTLTSCNDNIEQWSKALNEWKGAYEKTSFELNNCKSNSGILNKIKEIEYKKSQVESRLYSALDNELEKESVPFYQRQALEYQERIIELEKKLTTP